MDPTTFDRTTDFTETVTTTDSYTQTDTETETEIETGTQTDTELTDAQTDTECLTESYQVTGKNSRFGSSGESEFVTRYASPRDKNTDYTTETGTSRLSIDKSYTDDYSRTFQLSDTGGETGNSRKSSRKVSDSSVDPSYSQNTGTYSNENTVVKKYSTNDDDTEAYSMSQSDRTFESNRTFRTSNDTIVTVKSNTYSKNYSSQSRSDKSSRRSYDVTESYQSQSKSYSGTEKLDQSGSDREKYDSYSKSQSYSYDQYGNYDESQSRNYDSHDHSRTNDDSYTGSNYEASVRKSGSYDQSNSDSQRNDQSYTDSQMNDQSDYTENDQASYSGQSKSSESVRTEIDYSLKGLRPDSHMRSGSRDSPESSRLSDPETSVYERSRSRTPPAVSKTSNYSDSRYSRSSKSPTDYDSSQINENSRLSPDSRSDYTRTNSMSHTGTEKFTGSNKRSGSYSGSSRTNTHSRDRKYHKSVSGTGSDSYYGKKGTAESDGEKNRTGSDSYRQETGSNPQCSDQYSENYRRTGSNHNTGFKSRLPSYDSKSQYEEISNTYSNNSTLEYSKTDTKNYTTETYSHHSSVPKIEYTDCSESNYDVSKSEKSRKASEICPKSSSFHSLRSKFSPIEKEAENRASIRSQRYSTQPKPSDKISVSMSRSVSHGGRMSHRQTGSTGSGRFRGGVYPGNVDQNENRLSVKSSRNSSVKNNEVRKSKSTTSRVSEDFKEELEELLSDSERIRSQASRNVSNIVNHFT